jgi:hypothetical protein
MGKLSRFVVAFLLTFVVTRLAYRGLQFNPSEVAPSVPGWAIDFVVWVVVFSLCYGIVHFVWRVLISRLLANGRV